MRGRTLRAAGVALVALAFLVPFLAFGGRALAWAVLGSSVACALAAAAFACGGGRDAVVPRALAIPAVAILALGLLSLVPLPPSLVGILSPQRLVLQEAVPRGPAGIEAWADAVDPAPRSVAEILAEADASRAASREPPPPLGFVPLSYDPGRTLFAALALAGFLALAVALAACAGPRAGLAALSVVLLATAAGSAYGVWQSRAGAKLLYGVFEPPPNAPFTPYGTFWNANHFAGLAALLCPVALAVALDAGARWWTRAASALLLLPLAAAVLDCGSRGGLLAGGAGAIVLGLLLLRVPARRGVGLALVVAALAGMALVATVFADRVLDETFAQTVAPGHASNALRAEYYARQAEMARRAPFVGVGLGAFPTAWPVFKRTPESAVPLHGESDWLETAAEGGLPLLLAWGALVAALAAPPVRLALAGRATPLACGLLAASAGTLLHAAVDFHHREPAVAVASILVLATAHALARGGAGDSARGPSARALALASALAAAAASLYAVFMVPSDLAHRAADAARARGDFARERDHARRAVEAAPWRAESWALLAHAHEQLSLEVDVDRAAERRAAMEACVEALRRAPSTIGAARRAGSLLLSVGALREARAAAELARVAAPGHSPTRQLLGEILLDEGRPREALPHLAFAYVGTPVHELSDHASRFAELLREAAEADPKRLLAAVASEPHRVWYLYALAREGRSAELPGYLAALAAQRSYESPDDLAGVALLAPGPEALALARRLEPLVESPRAVLALARTHDLAGEREAARALYERAIAAPAPPEDAFTHLGDLHLALGRPGDARDTWTRGLELFPGNVWMRRRLESLP